MFFPISSALANVAMYGGAENQEVMIQKQVPRWLFPLAFNKDDTIKYFACLSIAVLVANKEIGESNFLVQNFTTSWHLRES